MGARSVLGNHDGAAIGTVDPGDFNPDAHAAINWTAGVLDDNARAYLAALPEVRRDGDLTAVHGSPRDPIWEYIGSTAPSAARRSRWSTARSSTPAAWASRATGTPPPPTSCWIPMPAAPPTGGSPTT